MVNDCPPGPGAYRRPRQLLEMLLLEMRYWRRGYLRPFWLSQVLATWV
jgi:hypothetical protein